MNSYEFLPCRALASFWRRCDAMPLQDVPHSLVRDRIAEIGQRTNDPVVSPTAILLSHPDDESFHFQIDSRPTGIGSAFGSVELLCDMLSVSSQNGVGFGHASYLGQSFASESLTDLGERGPLRIGKTQTRRQLRPQDAVFSGQIFVLKEQFLIDQTGDVGQQTDPAILFHAERP